MKPLAKGAAEAALRSTDWRQQGDVLKRLPPDVDAPLAAKVVLERLANRTWGFARTCQHLPPAVIREVLKQLEGATERDRLFLLEAVDRSADAPTLQRQWVEALQGLLDLDLTYAWGSKQRKAKFQALAKQPRLVKAIQAATVGDAQHPSLDMLAILSIEASDASVDALLPVFAKGQNGSWLESLRTHAAKTPALDALLAGQQARREEKERGSAAVRFVQKVLGLDEAPKSVDVRVTVNSADLNRNRVPRYQGSLAIDSKWDQWWSFHVSVVDESMDYRSTSFGVGEKSRDDLGLGRCAQLEELPAWLAAAQKKLKIRWFAHDSLYGSLRGKKRAQFASWVFGQLQER